jgi:hypothetical protein
VTFEEHLANHRNVDGTYDLDAAEEDRRYELETSPSEIVKLARKAAKHERKVWQDNETTRLRKQFVQPALSPDLDLAIKVPLGDSRAVDYGDMNHDRLRLRKDLRTETHINENRAFEAEMTHWTQTEQLLNNGETIAEAINRSR